MSSGVAGRASASSARIVRLLAVEDALEPAGLADHFGSHRAQLPSHRLREHLEPAGTLEVINEVEGFGDRRTDDDDTVAREKHHALVPKHTGKAIALPVCLGTS